MQAEAPIYFVVWWVLCEYSSFDHFPYAIHSNVSAIFDTYSFTTTPILRTH